MRSSDTEVLEEWSLVVQCAVHSQAAAGDRVCGKAEVARKACKAMRGQCEDHFVRRRGLRGELAQHLQHALGMRWYGREEEVHRRGGRQNHGQLRNAVCVSNAGFVKFCNLGF